MLAICSRKRSHGWAKLVVGGPLCQLKTSKNTVGCRRNLGLSFCNLANGKHLTWQIHRALQLQANTINCFAHTFRNFALISTCSTNIYHIISNLEIFMGEIPAPHKNRQILPHTTWIPSLIALRDPTKKLGSLKSKGFKSLPFAVSMAV